jgi:TM2 domain-containing membrane protein YozV
MKKLSIVSLVLCFVLLMVTQTNALVVTQTTQLSTRPDVKSLELGNFPIQSEADLLALTPKKIKEMTGKKLSFKQTIGLKLMQWKIKKALKKELKKHPRNGEEPKSQGIALILVLLVGLLGIHRFYLGYTAVGVIQLLTLGGCFIWALIDLIRIATGDLKPADGSDYENKL